MTLLRRFLWDTRGASAFELVLVLPVVALMVFGLFDVGMFAWRINTLEKATQAGARYAVVTAPVASGLSTTNFVGRSVTVGGTTTVLGQGDTIPAEALDPISCSNSACSCTGSQPPCPSPGFSSTAFQGILTRVKAYDPSVQAANLVVEYRGSGIGYAGDPDGLEVAPLVTVRLNAMRFSPLTGYLFRGGINLPDFAYSLTMEDGSGTTSN